MAKIIEKIVSQELPPKSTNVGWWNGKELKFYTNGEWKTNGGSNISLSDVFNSIPIKIRHKGETVMTFEEAGITKEQEELLALLMIVGSRYSLATTNEDFYTNVIQLSSTIGDFSINNMSKTSDYVYFYFEGDIGMGIYFYLKTKTIKFSW